MVERFVIDTSLLVGLVDERDKFHEAAKALANALESSTAKVFYFDCVVVETVGVLCRRSEEQKRSAQLPLLIENLGHYVTPAKISWTGNRIRHLYNEVIELVRQSNGQLNFNDALIALICRERKIPVIASFDQDFDQVAWLKRIAKPEDLTTA